MDKLDAPKDPAETPLDWLHRHQDGRIAEEARLAVKAGGAASLVEIRRQAGLAAVQRTCLNSRAAIAKRRTALLGPQALGDPWLNRLVVTLAQARGQATSIRS